MKMERIVYIRGKFKGNNKEMKEAYLYAKEIMIKYDLKPQYIGVIGGEWNGKKLLTIKKKEKKITDRELKNLNSLRKSYFNSHTNSISEYGVYDKNDLEKTHKVNREITVAVSRFGKILYKITEKVIYHMI